MKTETQIAAESMVERVKENQLTNEIQISSVSHFVIAGVTGSIPPAHGTHVLPSAENAPGGHGRQVVAAASLSGLCPGMHGRQARPSALCSPAGQSTQRSCSGDASLPGAQTEQTVVVVVLLVPSMSASPFEYSRYGQRLQTDPFPAGPWPAGHAVHSRPSTDASVGGHGVQRVEKLVYSQPKPGRHGSSSQAANGLRSVVAVRAGSYGTSVVSRTTQSVRSARYNASPSAAVLSVKCDCSIDSAPPCAATAPPIVVVWSSPTS